MDKGEQWADQLNNHPDLAPELCVVHPKFITCELLRLMKEPVLIIQSCMTQGNNMITKRSPIDNPIWMVSQESGTWNQITDSLQ